MVFVTAPDPPRRPGAARPAEYYDQYLEADRSHWWFRGRERILAALARSAVAPLPLGPIADVGCGPGGPTRCIFPRSRIVAIDLSARVLQGYTSADARVVADVERVPLRAASLSAVCAFDVLEHLADDAAALREWRRMLVPAGWLLLTVPAYMTLWSRSDDVDGHYRRYRRRPLRQLLLGAEFQIVRDTYFNTLLLPGVALVKWWERLRGVRKDAIDGRNPELDRRAPARVERALERAMALEAAWLRRAGLPAGVSIAVIARAAATETTR